MQEFHRAAGYSAVHKERTAAINLVNTCYHSCVDVTDVSRDSSVGIATLYGLDGTRNESRGGGGRYFPHSSRPALVFAQRPVQ